MIWINGKIADNKFLIFKIMFTNTFFRIVFLFAVKKIKTNVHLNKIQSAKCGKKLFILVEHFAESSIFILDSVV